MIVETAFLFWPVQVLGVAREWVYGTSKTLETLGMRELLGRNRVRFGRRRRGLVSEAQVEEAFLHHEDLGTSAEARESFAKPMNWTDNDIVSRRHFVMATGLAKRSNNL